MANIFSTRNTLTVLFVFVKRIVEKMPLNKLSKKYHVLKNTPEGKKLIDSQNRGRSNETFSRLSSAGSLESGITIRGSRKKAKPSTEGRTMNRVTPPPFFNLGDSPPEDDVFFAPTAALPKNATAGAGEFRIPAPPLPLPPRPESAIRLEAASEFSFSVRSSLPVSTDCANWRRLESTHLDHLGESSHKHDAAGGDTLCTEDISAIAPTEATSVSSGEYHSAVEEEPTPVIQKTIVSSVQPQPITPNVLFSVEKRRKSQLFDKDKWQQQRLVFAGESDEDQNSQEGDCSVDSEVSSPAMDDDSRKKWLANTSVNSRQKRERFSMLGRNTVVLMPSDSDSNDSRINGDVLLNIEETDDEEAEEEEVQKRPPPNQMSESKLNIVKEWLASSPSPQPLMVVQESGEDDKYPNHEEPLPANLSECTSKRLREESYANLMNDDTPPQQSVIQTGGGQCLTRVTERRSFSVQVSLSSDSSPSKTETKKVAKSVQVSSTSDSSQSRRNVREVTKSVQVSSSSDSSQSQRDVREVIKTIQMSSRSDSVASTRDIKEVTKSVQVSSRSDSSQSQSDVGEVTKSVQVSIATDSPVDDEAAAVGRLGSVPESSSSSIEILQVDGMSGGSNKGSPKPFKSRLSSPKATQDINLHLSITSSESSEGKENSRNRGQSNNAQSGNNSLSKSSLLHSPAIRPTGSQKFRLKIIESSSSNPPSPAKKNSGISERGRKSENSVLRPLDANQVAQPGNSQNTDATSRFDSTFDQIMRTPARHDNSFQGRDTILGRTFSPLSPVNEDNAWLNLISAPEQPPVVTIGSSGVSVSSDAELRNFAFAPPYSDQVHRPLPPLPPISAKKKKTKSPQARFNSDKAAPSQTNVNFTGSSSKLLADNPGGLSFLSSLSLDTPDPRCHPEAVKYVKNFKRHKQDLVKALFDLYNEHAFESQLPNDLVVTWNARLTKTAGICVQRKMIITKPDPETGRRLPEDVRLSKIELSTKVLDSADRVRDTLIHELCHAAAWIVSGYRDGHGPIWKAWGKKARSAFSELPIIDRCHSYNIRTKFQYKCTRCGYTIGRHSKSLDLERQCCGYCKGRFELVNKASTTTGSSAAVPATPKKPNAFAEFVKENYKNTRTPGSTHKDTMKALSQQFARSKI